MPARKRKPKQQQEQTQQEQPENGLIVANVDKNRDPEDKDVLIRSRCEVEAAGGVWEEGGEGEEGDDDLLLVEGDEPAAPTSRRPRSTTPRGGARTARSARQARSATIATSTDE